MTLSKFLSLLLRRALWFTRIDQLPDPWEGRYPRRHLREYLASLPEADQEWRRISLQARNESERKMSVVNCWHQNEHESAAMWSLYGGDDSIAVASTIGRLKQALNGCSDRIFIGEVEYRDFDSDDIPPDRNAFQTIVRKRPSFAHEREVRAIQWLILSSATEWGPDMIPSNLGVYVPIDVPKLMQQVYLAPGATSWLREVVEDLLVRYALECVPVIKSSIDDPYMV